MELNCIKSNVYVNDTLFSEACDFPIDVDFTLPDYNPDIMKILKCRAKPFISSKAVNGNSVTVDGSIVISVLYIDNEGKPAAYEYQYPFSKTFALNKDITGANVCCNAKTEYVNCRAVTNRKIDINGAVSLNCKIYKRKSTEIISDIEDSNIEIRRESIPATIPLGFTEKYTIVEEELELGQGKPQIESIIRYEIGSKITENRTINDKIIVKGDLLVNILYKSCDNASLQCFKQTVPYSQILDIEGITELCECDVKAEIAYADIKAHTLANGESRSFSLSVKILNTAECYCKNDITVITDAYSRNSNAVIKKENMPFLQIIQESVQECRISDTIILTDNIQNIYDISADVVSQTNSFKDGKMFINGTANIAVLYGNENGEANYYEKAVDYNCNFELGTTNANTFCDPVAEINDISYNISNENTIDLQFTVNNSANIYERTDVPLIVDLTIGENSVENNSNASMIIYFANEDKNLWDIAKEYNSSIEDIKKINHIENDIISTGETLLIPT